MEQTTVDHRGRHGQFIASNRKHILMITNHGIHQWNVIPGLPDTGGQNVFVNQFTETLVQLGYKVTIVNRGGYVHPETGEWQRGLRYKDAFQRILYIEDGTPKFIRKEDMNAQIPLLVDFLKRYIERESLSIDLILSHYWDAAKLGIELNNLLGRKVKHIWVPHSVGSLKKKNVKPEQWSKIRIDERIGIESELIAKLDGVAATSSKIRQSLKEDYGYETTLFLPPCVDAKRFYPHQVDEDDPVWQYLSEHSELSVAEIQKKKIITEVSRTDTTKRKNVLIQAFAEVHREIPDSFLALTIDDNQKQLAADLKDLIVREGIADCTAILGSVWDLLPSLYAVTDVYCTPSVMEGFGMAVQEAAATEVPVVSSNLVPFVEEFLLGDEVQTIPLEEDPAKPVQLGDGAIVARADFIPGFACAISRLLRDEKLRRTMGRKAYEITIPYFTWNVMVNHFLENIGENPV